MPKARQNAAMMGPTMNGPKNAAAAAIKKSTIVDLEDGATGVAEQFQPDIADVRGQRVRAALAQLAQLVGQGFEGLHLGLSAESLDFDRGFGLDEFLIGGGLGEADVGGNLVVSGVGGGVGRV